MMGQGEGTVVAYFNIPSRDFPRGSEKSVRHATGPRIEPVTSKIQSRNANHSTGKIDILLMFKDM
jgi:hypothetical protein